jgi:hypothetical protein
MMNHLCRSGNLCNLSLWLCPLLREAVTALLVANQIDIGMKQNILRTAIVSFSIILQ